MAPSGERYWGRFGAAGLLALDPDRGVLLQHRVGWSHHGGTWALPGGARHQGEAAIAGAMREAEEEAGVPEAAVRPRFSSVLDLGVWSYTTVVADVVSPFEPTINDPESHALEFVTPDAVADRPLHPGFAEAWAGLRDLLGVRPALVIDGANVVGSAPDGWWRDRSGAAGRLRDRLTRLGEDGIAAAELGLPATRWFPELSLVVEGQARAIADGGVPIVRADGEGDDTIADEAERLVAVGRTVTVITSDRELAGRVTDAGAAVRGARWLLDLLDADPEA